MGQIPLQGLNVRKNTSLGMNIPAFNPDLMTAMSIPLWNRLLGSAPQTGEQNSLTSLAQGAASIGFVFAFPELLIFDPHFSVLCLCLLF